MNSTDHQVGAVPYSHGSIFIGLNLHYDLGAAGAFAHLRRQAQIASEGGFHGVCLGEHHGDFPGYQPVPLQTVALLLPRMRTGWVAPCPLLLPLHSAQSIVEQVAWLHAAYPGRIGLGVATGYVTGEFEGFGVPFSDRANVMLRSDPAVREAAGRIPIAMSVGGERHVRLAAELGAALVAPQRTTIEATRSVFRAYQETGGTGARVLQRWVHLGTPPRDVVNRLNQLYGERRRHGDGPSAGIVPLIDDEPAGLADQIMEWVNEAGASALSVRFHLGWLDPDAVDAQIERFCAEVLPRIREVVATASSVTSR